MFIEECISLTIRGLCCNKAYLIDVTLVCVAVSNTKWHSCRHGRWHLVFISANISRLSEAARFTFVFSHVSL